MAASPTETPTREEPHLVVLEGIVGSTAYGLAHDDSDVDRLGIFIEPTASFLGLDGVPTRRQSWKQPGDDDRTLHEVGKYAAKVLGGNPTFTELLWLPNHLYTTVTPIGAELVDMRNAFLAAGPVRDSYLGYATQQFRKFDVRGGSFSSDTRKRTEKHARHMARLLLQGLHAWMTGEIVVNLRFLGNHFDFYRTMLIDALQWSRFDEHRDLPQLVTAFGRSVAGGDTTAAEVLMRDVEVQMDATNTPLPNEPDREVIDRWLRKTRVAQLNR